LNEIYVDKTTKIQFRIFNVLKRVRVGLILNTDTQPSSMCLVHLLVMLNWNITHFQ